MAYALQLDLFQEEDGFTLLEKRVSFVDKKLSNVQKGLFARFGIHDEKIMFLLELVQKQQMDIENMKKILGFGQEILNFTLENNPIGVE